LIIDTDVLILELRGNHKARDLIHSNIPFSISVVTYIELIQGMNDKKELNSFIRQLAKWDVDIVQINNNISTRAMIYVEQYFPKQFHGISGCTYSSNMRKHIRSTINCQ
jgi:hypothetical protein